MSAAETHGVPGPCKIVLGDANVLYSRVVRDYLVYASDEEAISIRWSRQILQEVVEHVALNRPTFTAESGTRLVALLNSAFPRAQVDISASAQRRVRALALPDEGDRHVLAAAVAGNVDVVCTDNIKHFPERVMSQLGIGALTADALLTQLINDLPIEMLAVHRRTVANLTGATDRSTLTALRKANAARAADRRASLLGKQ